MVTYSPSAVDSYGNLLTFGKIDETHDKIAKDLFLKVQNLAIKLGFDLGLLANAYTETNELKELFEKYSSTNNIYADSGGLQALTLGKDLTNEKPKIYKTQSNSSHWAMCFDEMPTKVLKERKDGAHSMLDQSGRYYIKDLIQPKGEATGQNIQEQINKFKKNNAIAKVMVILQGYGMDEMSAYAKAVYSQINKEDYGYIGGLAVGNTIGAGPFHLVDRIARYQYEMDFIPDEHKKHIHILAAGSPGKLLGALALPDTFWKWDKNSFRINADATSHSSSSVFGKYTSFCPITQKRLSNKTGKKFNNSTRLLIEGIYNFSVDIFEKHGLNLTFDDFRNQYTIYNDYNIVTQKDIDKENPDQIKQYKKIAHGGRFLWMIYELQIFFKCLKLVEMGHFSKVYLNNSQIKASVMLKKCDNLDTYFKMRRNIKIELHQEIIPIINNEAEILRKTQISKLF